MAGAGAMAGGGHTHLGLANRVEVKRTPRIGVVMLLPPRWQLRWHVGRRRRREIPLPFAGARVVEKLFTRRRVRYLLPPRGKLLETAHLYDAFYGNEVRAHRALLGRR